MAGLKEKHERLISQLLDGDYELNDASRKAFSEWREKGFDLTVRQEGWLEKVAFVLIDGGDPQNYEQTMTFGRVEIKQTPQGYFVHVDDNAIGKKVSKSEGPSIGSWLNSALDELSGLDGDGAEPGSDEDLPYEDNRSETETGTKAPF